MSEINQLCDPLEPISNAEHKHKCEKCGTCWKHSNDLLDKQPDAFDEAHACPTCGEEQTWKLRKDGTQVPQSDREASLFLRQLFGGGL